jgi:hypothetical protein
MTATTRTVYRTDPHVQVHVWLAKDKEGYTTTSSEGGRLSQEKDPGLARCGHVSMSIFAKHHPAVYVSFWPGAEDPAVLVKSYETDQHSENETLPDVIIALYQLNIERMLTVFAAAEKRVLAGRIAWTLQAAAGADVSSPKTAEANCATFVYSLLIAGGLTAPKSAYKRHLSGRGPSDKSFYKLTKCGAGDRAAGIANGAFWTTWKFTPKALLLRVASAAQAYTMDVQATRAIMMDTTLVAQEKTRGAAPAKKKEEHKGAKPEEHKGVKKKQPAQGVAVDKHGRTPLHHAAGSGQIALAGQLLRGSCKGSLESKDETGSTPLLLAAYFGKTQMCAFLLQSGANPYTQDDQGKNIAHYAVEKGNQDLLDLLTGSAKYAALFETADKAGDTPQQLLTAQSTDDLLTTALQSAATPTGGSTTTSSTEEGGCLVC